MKSEDNARPHFEKYMGNMAINIGRLANGKYADERVENSWLDYWMGWVHCSLFTTNEERAKLQKQIDEMRGST